MSGHGNFICLSTDYWSTSFTSLRPLHSLPYLTPSHCCDFLDHNLSSPLASSFLHPNSVLPCRKRPQKIEISELHTHVESRSLMPTRHHLRAYTSEFPSVFVAVNLLAASVLREACKECMLSKGICAPEVKFLHVYSLFFASVLQTQKARMLS